MQLKKATRQEAKIRILLAGPSGSGKTYSSLLLANGMAPWEKIAVIDTERGSADLYSHLGPYNTLSLSSPFSPERYIEAIKTCEDAGMEVIIIDSITHEWDGVGGILQSHETMQGNSFTNWSKLTPRHNSFIDAILQSKAHIICSVRSKQDYVLQDKNGRQVPEKVGMKAVTREGFDYEVTISFDIDLRHNAHCTKDRTGIFMKSSGLALNSAPVQFVINQETGRKITEWCNNPNSQMVNNPAPASKNGASLNGSASNGISHDSNGVAHHDNDEVKDEDSSYNNYMHDLQNCNDMSMLKRIALNIKNDDALSEDQIKELRKIFSEKKLSLEEAESF